MTPREEAYSCIKAGLKILEPETNLELNTAVNPVFTFMEVLAEKIKEDRVGQGDLEKVSERAFEEVSLLFKMLEQNMEVSTQAIREIEGKLNPIQIDEITGNTPI